MNWFEAIFDALDTLSMREKASPSSKPRSVLRQCIVITAILVGATALAVIVAKLR